MARPSIPHGRPRPFAAFWRKLTAALERTSFFTLTRRTPVRILTPRSERRLTRVMHAFGPITGAFFSVAGKGARESVSEQDLGLGYPLGIESDSFARTFELALEARGVPFARIGGEDRDVSLEGARWIICATSGGLNPELFRRLRRGGGSRRARHARPPRARLRRRLPPLPEPLDLAAPAAGAARRRPRADRGRPGRRRRRRVARHRRPRAAHAGACDPDGIFATVHEDAAGRARVVFLLNPGDGGRARARPLRGAAPSRAVDVLDEAVFEIKRGALEVRMTPRTVRMLALT